MSEQRERWAGDTCLCVCVCVILCEWNEKCLLRALNDRARWAMGRWCLSVCVILRVQCLPRALNEWAMQTMGWWHLSACVIYCEQSGQCLPKALNEQATRAMGRWCLFAYLHVWFCTCEVSHVFHERSESCWGAVFLPAASAAAGLHLTVNETDDWPWLTAKEALCFKIEGQTYNNQMIGS